MKLDAWTAELIDSKNVTLNRNELESYQLEKLNETIKFAGTESIFYGTYLHGVTLNTLNDLHALPFTYPKDCDEEMLCVPQRDISRIVTLDTSGTTGQSKRIFFTEADQKLTIDYFHYGMQHIIGSEDCLFVGMPCQRPGSIGDLLRIAVEDFGAKVVPFGLVISDEELASAVRILTTQEVTSLVGLPKQMALLAENTPGFQCKSVLLSADYVSDEVVELIKGLWKCEVFEHYGMTEMGLGCAVSCESHEGYHVREADLLIEIIDPETGKCLPDGMWGEIVFTTLTRKGMPFIRYRTGDISRWIPEPCPCGSQLKRLDKVQDRKMKKGGTLNER
jgi:phenylacetate-CoA ligase